MNAAANQEDQQQKNNNIQREREKEREQITNMQYINTKLEQLYI